MSHVTNTFDDKIVQLLKSGAVGFMPSDTIYGLSCKALDKSAVERIHKIKDRANSKPFIILISGKSDLKQLSISPGDISNLKTYWPGPLSIIFDAPNSPKWLRPGSKTLAVRMPNNRALFGLIKKCGPLVSTSANPDGEQPADSLAEARRYFGDTLDFYVDAGKLRGLPSTIAKLTKGKLEVVRAGAIILSEGKNNDV